MESINEVLSKIQTELKAPKDKYNSFSKFYYRSCEGILEGLKPLLKKYDVCIIVTDTIVHFGASHPAVLVEEKIYNADRFYVRATATLKWKDQEVSANSFAREEDHKKGMDSSQLTGATSSYARKYALNGLLAIDDTKDADHGTAPVAKDTPKVDETLKAAVMSKAKEQFASGPVFKQWRASNGLPEAIKAFTNADFKKALDLFIAEEGAK